MRADRIIEEIESLAPLELQESWDDSGVQIAGTDGDIARLAVTLDPMPGPLAAALDWGAGLILCHHPLAIEPRLPKKRDAFHEALRLVLGRDAWLYAAHTSLDAATAGPVSWLARELGLTGLAPLAPNPDHPDVGLGFVGEFSAPLPYERFEQALARAVGRSHWTTCQKAPETVSRLACCPGSGSSLVSRAEQAGADVFVTGEMKYHPALVSPVHVVDVGHFCLEEEMMRRTAELLQSGIGARGVEVRFFPSEEPFRLALPGA